MSRGRAVGARLVLDDLLPHLDEVVEVVNVSEHERPLLLRIRELLPEVVGAHIVDAGETAVLDADPCRQQPRYVEVVDPEERQRQRRVVHAHDDVRRQQEGEARAVGREVVGPVLLPRDVPLALRVPHHLVIVMSYFSRCTSHLFII